jgi:hypothetical protein
MIVYLINSSFCPFVRCVELVICNNKEVKQNGTVGWDGMGWGKKRVAGDFGAIFLGLLEECVGSTHQATE